MAGMKFDGVIEAVRYTPEGTIGLVRAYERRGATFSDHVLLDRKTLLERLKKGKKFAIGRRTKQLASTFETSKKVHLAGGKGHEVITTSEKTERDLLEEAPIF